MSVQKSSTQRLWQSSRFDQQDAEPLGPLANLLDLMLVFACGLIAALISLSGNVSEHFDSRHDLEKQTHNVVEKGRELPQLPGKAGAVGAGYESVGQVYRDPETGKLILIGK